MGHLYHGELAMSWPDGKPVMYRTSFLEDQAPGFLGFSYG